MHRLFYMYLLPIYCVCTCMHTHVQVYEVCSRMFIDYFTCIYYLFIVYVIVCAYTQVRGRLVRVVSVLP